MMHGGLSEENGVEILDVESFRTNLTEQHITELSKTHEPERTIIIKDLINKLSFPAKLLVHIVMEMPDGLIEKMRGKKIGSGKTVLERYFVNEKCWRRSIVKMVWEELQTLIKKIDEL